MYHYTVEQWLFFFYFYCFFGWCFESTYVSVKKGHFVNRGFMRGPFLPLYGSGAIMMLFISKLFGGHLVLTFFAGCIGATALEYVTGVAMESLFKVRYWDYSNQKFNFQGQICLGSSLAWGALTIFMTEILHKPVERFVLSIPSLILRVITFGLTCYVVSDFIFAFKAALDLKDILLRIEKVKEELKHLQKRLDVVIAFTENDIEEKRQEKELAKELRAAELRAVIEEHVNTLKELKEKNKYRISMMRGNPGMVSRRFKDTLEELKTNYFNKNEENK